MPTPLWKTISTDETVVSSLEEALGIHPALCRLLAQRGIHSSAEAEHFFHPQWDDLHDPFLMKDMDRAVQRLDLALRRNENILIYGDYDVDGTMSVSLLFHFLNQLGHRHLDYYFPDRYKEGYGLSAEGIKYAHERDVSLLITVDCGIRAKEQVDNARSQGMDVIICDHHLPGDDWPFATAVLDPKRPDCPYPFKELSGCGVAFKLAQGLLYYQDRSDELLEAYTDFVAISIASDVVPIIGENRILAHYGLREINRTRRPGLKALIKASHRKKPIQISDIVFGIGPIINASGRMANAGKVVQLMLAANRRIAEEHAATMKEQNTLRREYDRRSADEARQAVTEDPNWEDQASIVLYEPHWHQGIIGIVAARLATDFHRPIVILTKVDDQLVGSARSVSEIDLFEAIESCEDLLESYGGHTYAAGLSMEESNWPEFARRFDAAIRQQTPPAGLQPSIDIAAELPISEITPAFYKYLQQFAPFGPHNRNPVFVAPAVEISGQVELLKEEHLRLMLRDTDGSEWPAIAFGKGDQFETLGQHSRFGICYSLQENHWQGKSQLQLMIRDFDFSMDKWPTKT